MTTFLIILAIVIAILLVLIVLVQNPKGGGLTSGFSSSNNIMGVQRTGDFLEKGSWGLAIALFVIAVLINVTATTSTGGSVNPSKSRIQEQIDKTALPSSLPAMPQSGDKADTTKK
ncbi:preprotein translocase, SecG subunit [Pseudopedobacter saltans DSM 12145]|uniref:Protein-export membrane protein SecG n=1 Tax=Pseudopedobacter saltans (strain ATCC 51119 / DSM 12145 / JCM 21818 / CCUG 39354 / LMG 10337 / NBRC 100064 / NCIMB 13643) TaxID=762903 RepID=F0SF39_PSESL|nr:preprotein translocase subunit SecG [Pseudopedobacter saltans]ADY54107.1 preprotein translocase, SecG subunit [Pseudopedobacter saltans DSM 12145]